MDFEVIVIKKLDELKDDVGELKVQNAIQTACIEQNTKDLADHKEGVIQNRKRIIFLEEQHKPMTVKQFCKRALYVIGGIGTIATAIYGVMKLLDM